MKNFSFGVLLVVVIVFVFRSCNKSKIDKSILAENTMLIQKEINNVSKLIVTEGHFAEVYNYKDSQEFLGALFTANKKALVVVNADVTIAYDLSEIVYDINEETKTLHIISIPEPEVKINPDFEYYDITADYFNPFESEDYNKIKRNVRFSLLKKIEASSLKTNAENRLISELSKFYMLTNSMGWKLIYERDTINTLEDFNIVKPFSLKQ